MSGTPKQARAAVTAIFLLNGLIFGAWAARIPAVRDRVGLSDGELGIVLACAAVGSILAMPIAGGRAARIGSRRATRAAFALVCLATGLIALAPSLPVLCLLAFFYGASMGSLDVTMNAHGVAVERRYGRSILASFHAAFSIGGLAGGVIGAVCAGIGLDVRVQLALVAVVSAAVGLTWSRRFLGGDADAIGHAEPVFVRPPRRLLALGVLAFACLLIEGASADWSAVYLRDELGTTAAMAAIGFTAFSVTMTLGRVFGDRLVDHFGPEAVVRAGGGIAAVGFGLAAPGRLAGRRDRRLRVPGRRHVGRRADRLPCRGPRPRHARGRRVGRGVEHRLPRLPRRAADDRRPGRADRPARGPGRARRAGHGRRPAGAHHPLRARRLVRRARASDGGGMTTILSDLDGVLVDSHASIMRAWRWWGAAHGVAVEAIESVQQGRPSGEVIAALVPDLDAAAESRAIDLRQADDVDGVSALPGAHELFAGSDPVAIVTSCTVPLATARLRAVGLAVPQVLVTPERLSRGKPDPEGYLLAARELGAAPADCVVLEDAPAGVAAGRAAGMHVVGITTTHDPAELDAHELAPSIAAWLASRNGAAR